jgi:hypothetical protein
MLLNHMEEVSTCMMPRQDPNGPLAAVPVVELAAPWAAAVAVESLSQVQEAAALPHNLKPMMELAIAQLVTEWSLMVQVVRQPH